MPATAPVSQEPVSYPCPYCNTRKLETVGTAPYIRGFVLAFQYGSKTYIGCVPCVRNKILQEAGLSSLIGWFSISSLIVNPFLIVYNLVQSPFVKPNYGKVRQKLREIGIPEDQAEEVNVTQLCYALAASMIGADGKVEQAEITTAQELGKQLFPDFDPSAFQAVVADFRKLPSHLDQATLLAEILTDAGKHAIYLYLMAIAQADGNFDASEQKMLAEVAHRLGYTPPPPAPPAAIV